MKKILILGLMMTVGALAHEGHLDFGSPVDNTEIVPLKRKKEVKSFVETVKKNSDKENILTKEEPKKIEETKTIVKEDKITTNVKPQEDFSAASNKNVRQFDLALRPLSRPADILSTVPGFYVIQHAGGGKANQYFLRGFDLDHGTDVDLRVDGVPLNMVSHGHGQGYADGNFIIPETIADIEVYKGSYRADQGDLSTAGSIRMKTADSFKQNTVSVTAGDNNTTRLFMGLSPKFEGLKTLLAAEIYHTDGPFNNKENLQRYNIFSKVTSNPTENSKLSLGMSLYSGNWNASGQIPLRAVEAGTLDRFGSLDTTDGGFTQRNHVFADYVIANERDEISFNIYNINYNFSLFSNFTFYSADPVNGDQINQVDNRNTFGGQVKYKKNITDDISNPHFLTFGTQWRRDKIHNFLFNSVEREKTGIVSDHDISQTNVGLFVEDEYRWNSWMSSVIGLRADNISFQVDDKQEDFSTTGNRTSGQRMASMLQPKANLVFNTTDSLDIFLNYGRSFHSNDARGTSNDVNSVDPLTKADTYEIGMRQFLLNKTLTYSLSAYVIKLDAERVWVGDAAESEKKLSSERRGVELEVRYSPNKQISFDADFNYNRSHLIRAEEGNDAVPLAPTLIAGAGITVNKESGVYGRLGVFHIGDRPASEDRYFTAEGHTRVDLTLGKKIKQWDVSLKFQNLFNEEIKEAQFVNTSRQKNENSCAGRSRVDNSNGFVGCEDIHFTPGLPLTISGKITYSF